MKIRQTYLCGDDRITVRFLYSNIGLIVGMNEIDSDSDLLDDEFNVPKIDVTNEQFIKIINHSRLR